MRWQLIQLAVAHRTAELEVKQPQASGAPYTARLSLDSISAQDLEGDFLRKLGIDLARPKAVLGKLTPEGPAMQAGLREGDMILAVNGVPMVDGVALIEMVRASPGKLLRMQVQRGQQRLEIAVTPDARQLDGKTIGQIKVEIPVAPEMVRASYPPLEAFGKAVQRTWDSSVLTLKMLGKMLIGELSLKNISGPITIADYAGQTARIGLISYLSFIALISISLGVMNLLPIPVLDGGHLMYYSLEVLTGRPLSERAGEIAQRAGMGLLMALMVVAVFNDLVRLMS
jgi:regulator of sigma E protease